MNSRLDVTHRVHARGPAADEDSPRRGPRTDIPVLRFDIAPTTGLAGLTRRTLLSHADAALVLAPFLRAHPASRRLAAALVDDHDRLLAVALYDGDDDSACCLRPSDLCDALVLTGATSAWLAHRHRSHRLHFVRQDVQSSEATHALMRPLGLSLRDHLIVGASSSASWRENEAAHALFWPLPQGRRVAPRIEHSLPANLPAATSVAPAPTRHVAFTLVGQRLLRLDAVGLPTVGRPRVESHADMARLLAPALDAAPWIAGLLDERSRLMAVALVDSVADHPCRIAPADVYRAALMLGARRVCLAHRHAEGRAWPSHDDRESARRAHAMGFQLGRELVDVLVFGRGASYVSLRGLRSNVAQWDDARARNDPDHPAQALRIHQANANRRPTQRHTRHAAAARAALWRCQECRRRQNALASCRYCDAPRPGVAAARFDHVQRGTA